MMNKIAIHLIYPDDFKMDSKDLWVSEFEFNALTKCSKIGSEGRYFDIEDMFFEDTEIGCSVSILLK